MRLLAFQSQAQTILDAVEYKEREGSEPQRNSVESTVADLQLQDKKIDSGGFLNSYRRSIYAIAVRVLRDPAEAEDLVQDVFLSIRKKIAFFDSTKGSARSWIIHMAYQRAIERRRYLACRNFYNREDGQLRVERLAGTPAREEDYSPEIVFSRMGLTKALDSLTGDQRETIRLYFFEGYTLAEIAARFGQSLGNVRNHYYRGLDKLRKAVRKRPLPQGAAHGK